METFEGNPEVATTQNDASELDRGNPLLEVKNLVNEIKTSPVQRSLQPVVCWGCRGHHRLSDCSTTTEKTKKLLQLRGELGGMHRK